VNRACDGADPRPQINVELNGPTPVGNRLLHDLQTPVPEIPRQSLRHLRVGLERIDPRAARQYRPRVQPLVGTDVQDHLATFDVSRDEILDRIHFSS